jgi:hypothetical protein
MIGEFCMRRNTILLLAGAVSVAAGSGAWFLLKAHSRPVIRMDDGTVLRDLSPAEAGVFAGDKFQPLRVAYLENREVYDKMAMMPVTDEPDAVSRLVEQQVERAMENSSEMRRLVDRLGEAAKADLAEQFALVVAVAGGLPRQAYLARLPEGRNLSLPPNLDLPNDSPLLRSTPTEAELLAEFEARYDNYEQTPDAHVIGVAAENDGWVVQIFSGPTSYVFAQPPGELAMSDRERKLFVGNISSAALTFHNSNAHWLGIRDRHETLPRARVFTIAETRSGDRFPLQAVFFYDIQAEQWFLQGVWQLISIPTLLMPSLVF